MGAGTRFDLVGQHAVVRGYPWSMPEMILRQGERGPVVNLTGFSAALHVFDATQLSLPPLVFGTTSGHIPTLGVGGTINCSLGLADVASLPGRAAYRLVITDSLGIPRPYLRGRLAVLDE